MQDIKGRKLAQIALDAACKHRDCVDRVPFKVQQKLYDKAAKAFERYCKHRNLDTAEELAEQDALQKAMAKIPRKTPMPGKDY